MAISDWVTIGLTLSYCHSVPSDAQCVGLTPARTAYKSRRSVDKTVSKTVQQEQTSLEDNPPSSSVELIITDSRIPKLALGIKVARGIPFISDSLPPPSPIQSVNRVVNCQIINFTTLSTTRFTVCKQIQCECGLIVGTNPQVESQGCEKRKPEGRKGWTNLFLGDICLSTWEPADWLSHSFWLARADSLKQKSSLGS